MNEILRYISLIGSESIRYFWIPLLTWTILVLLAKMILYFAKRLPAQQLFHAHLALLLALPVGFLNYILFHSFFNANAISKSISPIQIVLPISTNLPASNALFTTHSDFWFGIIVLILIAGIFLKLIKLLNSLDELKKVRQNLPLLEPLHISGISIANHEYLQCVRRNIQIAFSTDNAIPMTFGFFHPVILLPEFLASVPDKLNLVLHHELEHIRQHDYIRFGLISLLKAFFWFHPLIWLLEKNISTYREMEIDEKVISQNKDSLSEYAQLLLNMTDRPFTQLLPVGLAMKSSSTIKKRIVAMTNVKSTHNYRWLSASLAMLVLIIAFSMGCTNTINDNSPSKITNSTQKYHSHNIGLHSAPMIILDGKIIGNKTMKNLDPQEIASVSVWKGQKATAKFGKKGKYGVIVIITKNHKSND